MAGGGSKKGERRGGRRRGSQNKITVERMERIAVALGKGELTILPREVMLQAMRHFYEMALTAHGEVNRLLAVPGLALPDDDAKAQALAAESRFERYMILAGDLAYKAAPYLHARLQAIHVSGGGHDPQQRANPIAELLKEINANMRKPGSLLLTHRDDDDGGEDDGRSDGGPTSH